jgi:hypothetical protein
MEIDAKGDVKFKANVRRLILLRALSNFFQKVFSSLLWIMESLVLFWKKCVVV